ncbi:hypothetical protein [Rhizobium sp. C4]|uniref:hypothetical protein n=1 Tax=Rhizobium sp. C4 TaxID=1349800 RepID=UPI001E3987BB|nr:hypothetical protein [Rhizobium sp. C4]MCD2175380.1 hypothetical protein [Rhizobium sp. C4]
MLEPFLFGMKEPHCEGAEKRGENDRHPQGCQCAIGFFKPLKNISYYCLIEIERTLSSFFRTSAFPAETHKVCFSSRA